MSLEPAQIGSAFLKRFPVVKGVFKANLKKPDRERERGCKGLLQELSSTWKSTLQESQVLSSFPYFLL